MIDIHSHIIFGVDDGSSSLEESIEMISSSYNMGVRKIIATPHDKAADYINDKEQIIKNYEIVKLEAERRFKGLEILLGSEIYYSLPKWEDILNGDYIPIADTNYVLIEFPVHIHFETMYDVLLKIVNLNLKPILAHAERYSAIEYNKDYLDELIGIGCYIQVNASSLIRKNIFKKNVLNKRTEFLLKNNKLHFIASDMHNMKNRSSKIDKAYKLVCRKYGKKKATRLFEYNQKKMLQNESICLD